VFATVFIFSEFKILKFQILKNRKWFCMFPLILLYQCLVIKTCAQLI